MISGGSWVTLNHLEAGMHRVGAYVEIPGIGPLKIDAAWTVIDTKVYMGQVQLYGPIPHLKTRTRMFDETVNQELRQDLEVALKKYMTDVIEVVDEPT